VPARDAGLDDASVEDAGLGSGTPAPDPLKHASADVDQAQLAEAGSGRGASGDVPDEESAEYLPAPDAVEGDATRRTRGDLDPAVAEEQAAARAAKPRGRVLAFLGHCVDELRRVQWPDRRQVGQATAVVLGFVVLAGGYLGLMDAIWKPLVNAIL
jgi:preprotein translocase SecE subunit